MAETVGSVNEWNMPYMNAERFLQDKYKATQEEILLWIESKEITPKDAWCIIDLGGKEKEVLRWNLSGMEPDDLRNTLLRLYFNEDEIKNFVPEVRWVSFKQIVERWEKYGVNSFDAAATLHNHIGVMPSNKEIKDDENLHMYQYPLSDIEEIEKSFPALAVAQAEAVGDDGAGSQDDNTYKKRFTSFEEWLTKSPLKLDDFDTNRTIFQAVQKTGDKDKKGKPLWNLKCETGSDSFYTEFFRRYCKDTGYKRKGRKERLKNRQ